MKALIDVYRMTEVSPKTRASIIIKLGHAIHHEYGTNITEPLVYELVKHLDPDNPIMESEHYKSFIRI